jgi:hypothetical protein
MTAHGARRPGRIERLARSGYCQAMAPSRRPESIDASDQQRAVVVPRSTAGERYDPVAEQEEARRARAGRDREQSTAERLQRLHDLCAQLATMTPARAREPR